MIAAMRRYFALLPFISVWLPTMAAEPASLLRYTFTQGQSLHYKYRLMTKTNPGKLVTATTPESGFLFVMTLTVNTVGKDGAANISLSCTYTMIHSNDDSSPSDCGEAYQFEVSNVGKISGLKAIHPISLEDVSPNNDLGLAPGTPLAMMNYYHLKVLLHWLFIPLSEHPVTVGSTFATDQSTTQQMMLGTFTLHREFSLSGTNFKRLHATAKIHADPVKIPFPNFAAFAALSDIKDTTTVAELNSRADSVNNAKAESEASYDGEAKIESDRVTGWPLLLTSTERMTVTMSLPEGSNPEYIRKLSENGPAVTTFTFELKRN